MSEYTPNLNLFKYNPDTDGKEVFSITQALNHNWDILDNLGSGRNIGEIVVSTLPLEDAGLHLLDGALIDGSGIYSEFVQYIANLYSNNPTANYFTDETSWQSSVSTYGVCGKFVYDSMDNIVRLPKVTGKIDGTTDINALGDLEPLFVKLPNITGGVTDFFCGGPSGSAAITGAFSAKGSGHNYGGGSSGGVGFDFDASRSSSVYSGDGTDTTIHEQAINVLLYIVMATSNKTDIHVDIDEIATDLNCKVDKADLAEVQCVIEPYVNGTSWYRVYSDGWCEQGGKFNANNTATTASYTVNLLKSYKDTNYSIVTCGYSNHADQFKNGVAPYSFTTSSFVIQTFNNDALQPIVWQASGYIEV